MPQCVAQCRLAWSCSFGGTQSKKFRYGLNYVLWRDTIKAVLDGTLCLTHATDNDYNDRIELSSRHKDLEQTLCVSETLTETHPLSLMGMI
mmetsp:Transcript_40096/g.66530  ORF Transcript_40096/g.66530 Transcript_40096/m.66530 type:complete len:91 (-) Transcript_40096:474-746(-)